MKSLFISDVLVLAFSLVYAVELKSVVNFELFGGRKTPERFHGSIEDVAIVVSSSEGSSCEKNPLRVWQGWKILGVVSTLSV